MWRPRPKAGYLLFICFPVKDLHSKPLVKKRLCLGGLFPLQAENAVFLSFLTRHLFLYIHAKASGERSLGCCTWLGDVMPLVERHAQSCAFMSGHGRNVRPGIIVVCVAFQRVGLGPNQHIQNRLPALHDPPVLGEQHQLVKIGNSPRTP